MSYYINYLQENRLVSLGISVIHPISLSQQQNLNEKRLHKSGLLPQSPPSRAYSLGLFIILTPALLSTDKHFPVLPPCMAELLSEPHFTLKCSSAVLSFTPSQILAFRDFSFPSPALWHRLSRLFDLCVMCQRALLSLCELHKLR